MGPTPSALAMRARSRRLGRGETRDDAVDVADIGEDIAEGPASPLPARLRGGMKSAGRASAGLTAGTSSDMVATSDSAEETLVIESQEPAMRSDPNEMRTSQMKPSWNGGGRQAPRGE